MRIGILALIVLLGGCGSLYVKQSSIVDSSGTKFYMLSDLMVATESSKRTAEKQLDRRSRQICPSGYQIANQEEENLRHPFGFYSSTWELKWQIRCTTQVSPTSLNSTPVESSAVAIYAYLNN